VMTAVLPWSLLMVEVLSRVASVGPSHRSDVTARQLGRVRPYGDRTL
jgi:hypothetical protein